MNRKRLTAARALRSLPCPMPQRFVIEPVLDIPGN
jgi:hypothetical protein